MLLEMMTLVSERLFCWKHPVFLKLQEMMLKLLSIKWEDSECQLKGEGEEASMSSADNRSQIFGRRHLKSITASRTRPSCSFLLATLNLSFLSFDFQCSNIPM